MFGRCLQIMNDQIIKIYTRQQYLTCRHICKRPYGGPNNNDKASHRKTVHPDTVNGYSRFIKSALAVMRVWKLWLWVLGKEWSWQAVKQVPVHHANMQQSFAQCCWLDRVLHALSMRPWLNSEQVLRSRGIFHTSMKWSRMYSYPNYAPSALQSCRTNLPLVSHPNEK